MKKLLLPILATLSLSCSNDDNNCEANRQAINEKYEAQIQQAKDHPGVNGIDYRQITLLQQERDKKLENACN